MESAGGAVVDFGRFVTGFLVVMGIGRLGVFFFSKKWERSGRGGEGGGEEVRLRGGLQGGE